jgi:hypothetical protein
MTRIWESLAKDCCATFTQEVIYCKAWAKGDTRVTNSIPHPPCCGFGRPGDRCSEVIAKTWQDARAYGRDSEYFSSQDYEAAQRLQQQEAQDVEKRNTFERNRCTKDDTRSASEQASDPRCVIMKQNREIEEATANKRRQMEQAKQDEMSRLDIQQGQSQSTVRAILAKNGYAPWRCEGNWQGPEWLAECTSLKGIFRIRMLFTIYKRISYLDPNSLRPQQKDIATNELLGISMDIPGTPY